MGPARLVFTAATVLPTLHILVSAFVAHPTVGAGLSPQRRLGDVVEG